MADQIWHDGVPFTEADVREAGIKIRRVSRWVNGYRFDDLRLSPDLNCSLLLDFLALFAEDERQCHR